MKFPSTVTTKGQVTIPKAVREFLNIESGSSLVFTIEPEDQRVYIKVEDKILKCVLCKGSGQLTFQQPCFFCLEKGEIPLPFRPVPLIPIWQSKYNVVISFNMKNVESQNGLIFAPEVTIHHITYLISELLLAKDMILISLFQEFLARDRQFLSQDEMTLLKTRLDTKDIQERVIQWFQLEG